jgi:ADP-ribose pyrophosphatase YjhB (NUDIX family)
MSQNGRNLPHVGVGVIVVNPSGKILIGKRKGSHAPYYSIPGGHLELGETFEEAAIREIREETDLDIMDPRVICVTNNLRTYQEEGKHVASICLLATDFSGTPRVMEPDKCEGWQWCDPHNLPQPHFEASQWTVRCYLDGRFYLSVF